MSVAVPMVLDPDVGVIVGAVATTADPSSPLPLPPSSPVGGRSDVSVAVPMVLDDDVRIIGGLEGRAVDAWEEMATPDTLAELATAALLLINLVDEDGADGVEACATTEFVVNGPAVRVPVTPPAAPINTAPVPTHAAITLDTVHETITLGLRIVTPHQ